MISSKSRTSERVHHESRCIYIYFLLVKKKRVTLQEDEQEDAAKTNAALNYKWTWPLTMHPFKTIHENMTRDIFRNDNSWKCKLIPLRALGNQLNSLWDVLYLCLILVSVSVTFDLFYSPRMGPISWPRTHTLPTPLFDSANAPAKECFLANSLNLETSARDRGWFVSWLGR